MSKVDVKRHIGHYWPSTNQVGRKVILLYHSIGNTCWGMPKQNFISQMDWIMDHCQVLTLSDLIKSKPNKEIQIALTFDDGYQTLYEQVAPILVKKNISGTVYINTGWMGETESHRKKSIAALGHYPEELFLTWHEVGVLHKMGWEIGSHWV